MRASSVKNPVAWAEVCKDTVEICGRVTRGADLTIEIAEGLMRQRQAAADNHHNAARCPYCIPSDELRAALRDMDASALLEAVELYRWANRPLCLAEYPLPIGGPLKCTLDPGHAGDHDASGCQTWPNQPNGTSGGALAGEGSSTT